MSDKNLQLTAQEPAAVEKTEAQRRQRIKAWFALMRNAGAQMIGYKVMIGHELNEAAATATHGTFEQWVEEEYGLAKSTQHDWRNFSALFLEEVKKQEVSPTAGKSPTAGLLRSPKVLKTKKAMAAILEIAPRIMDGRGMVEFCREIRLLNEAKPDGGYRPDPEMVREFLAAAHPELNRTPGPGVPTWPSYEELGAKVQAEFRKWLAARPEPASEIARRAEEQGKAHNRAMLAAITGKWAMAMSKELRAKALTLAEKWVEKLERLNAKG
jgi:hypothetical protein